jgi:hypothetical protein
MDDWTKPFKKESFPLIQKLYAANGAPEDHLDCEHWHTDHCYHQPKRERTYWWMEKWLRGKKTETIEPEPKIEIIPPKTLEALTVDGAAGKGYPEISNVYRRERGYQQAKISSRSDWLAYRQSMTGTLRELLGESGKLPRQTTAEQISQDVDQDLVTERWIYPSEGGIRIPAKVLHRQNATGRLPIVLICSAGDRDNPGEKEVIELARRLAMEGSLVVLPHVRFTGEYTLAKMQKLSMPDPSDLKAATPAFVSAVPGATESPWLAPTGSFGATTPFDVESAWLSDSLVWGRPLPGMGTTDIQSVLDSLASRPDADMDNIRVISRQSAASAVAVLFAAVLDHRITAVDVDFQECCFAKGNLPMVPFVLQHGDVLQWAALLADRQLTIRNAPAQAGDVTWLSSVFTATGNAKGIFISVN